ncbi:hypothetical protein COB55_03800 [Candidatus Wolfebacteria bacterium]|nr:MAG: hypothetical protein COB55_03800 [Candidatus Wolfebacteria bacterium]
MYKHFQGFVYTDNGGFYTSNTIYTMRTIFFAIIFAPLWEELLFRFFPLEIYKSIGDKRLLLPIVFASSIIFGWLHGGVVNILIQGVSGLTMSWVYINHNGGYWAGVLSHAFWNTMIVFGLPSIASLVL